MADPRQDRHDHAYGGLRDRGPTGRRGHDDERPLPVADVRLFHAPDCHLCERALAVLREVQAELHFELELVDISEDPELESGYRELLPVVEIDGKRAFTYFVEPAALRRRLGNP